MNITQGNMYWNKKNNIKYAYPYIRSNRKCDVVVVGGGITGALSAYYQAKAGFNVCLIEKNIIGYGHTLENLGIVYSKLDANDVRKQKYLGAEDIDKCNELLKESIMEIEKIVAEVNTEKAQSNLKVNKQDLLEFSDRFSGKIKINKAYDKLLESNNIENNDSKNIQYVTENNVLKISNGLIEKDSVLVLNPYELAQELIYMLSKLKNVEIYENTEAEVIHSLKDKVEIITHNKFKIIAEKCILATSINAIKYFKDIDFEICKNYTIVTDRLNNENTEKELFVAVDNNIPNHTIRFYENHMLISGEELVLKERIVTEDIENKSFDGKYKKLFNYLQSIYKDTNIPKIKSCFYSVDIKTKDGLPLIDEVYGMPNVYCNLALGKNSIAYACIGAKMLQNICKDYYTKNMYLFRANR